MAVAAREQTPDPTRDSRSSRAAQAKSAGLLPEVRSVVPRPGPAGPEYLLLVVVHLVPLCTIVCDKSTQKGVARVA